MVLKRSKMKPVGNVMKLFMKEATVKMSENCSSWALQSGREKRRSQESRDPPSIPRPPARSGLGLGLGLGSGREKRRSQEPRMGRLIPLHLHPPARSRAASSSLDSLPGGKFSLR